MKTAFFRAVFRIRFSFFGKKDIKSGDFPVFRPSIPEIAVIPHSLSAYVTEMRISFLHIRHSFFIFVLLSAG